MQDSSMPTPSRTLRYSGNDRPAWRMNHTGVWGTGSPRAALTRAESEAAACGDAEGPLGGGADMAPVSQRGPRRLSGPGPCWSASRVFPPGRVGRAYADVMATRMPTSADVTALPQPFRDAVAQMRSARLRAEIICEEMPAPQRIAPFSAALAADVVVDGDEIGTGRLVLLHDPTGNDTWGGTFRCVAYARAELTADFATDPVLADVAWTWLVEALEANDAEHVAPSGTVTRVISESFGQMADDG